MTTKHTQAAALPVFSSEMDMASYLQTQGTHAGFAIGVLAGVNELLEAGDWRGALANTAKALRALRGPYLITPSAAGPRAWDVRSRIAESEQAP